MNKCYLWILFYSLLTLSFAMDSNRDEENSFFKKKELILFLMKTNAENIFLYNEKLQPQEVDIFFKRKESLKANEQIALWAPPKGFDFCLLNQDFKGISKISKKMKIKNNSNEAKNFTIWITQKYLIKTGQTIRIEKPETYQWALPSLINNPLLNILYHKNTLTFIENINERPAYPPFSTIKNLEEEAKKRENCWGVDLFKLLREKQTLNHSDVLKTLSNAYLKFHPNVFLKDYQGLRDNPKIPKITHTIWLTNKTEIKPFKEAYEEDLLSFVETCSPAEGWRHIVWINVEGVISETLHNKPAVIINLIPEQLFNERAFQIEMNHQNYGAASDILRYELLYKYGGLYRDIDCKAYQSFEFFHQFYDCYVNLEQHFGYLNNALIGGRLGHPLFKRCFEKIKQNYEDSEIFNFIKNKTRETVAKTGPILLTQALYETLAHEKNEKIGVFDPIFFNPIIEGQKNSLPAETASVHYWKGSWIN